MRHGMDASLDPVGNATAAQGQAQACVGDDAAMGRLRSAAVAVLPTGINFVNLDDAAVAELAAAALAAGTLNLGRAAAPSTLLRLARAAPPTSAPAPSSSSAARPAPAASAPAPSPAAGSFPPSLDAVAMAETLREASQSGQAFCEECEREAMS